MISTEAKVKIALAVVVVGAGAYIAYRIAGGIKPALQAVNPFNNDNIINKEFTSMYQAVTGSEGTLGTDIYDATHGGALDVTSDSNFVASGVNSLGAAASGDKNWTLGTWIYDITHPGS